MAVVSDAGKHCSTAAVPSESRNNACASAIEKRVSSLYPRGASFPARYVGAS